MAHHDSFHSSRRTLLLTAAASFGLMAALPLHVNVLEAIVLPTTQKYLGRG